MNGYNAKKTGRKDGYSYAYSYGYYDKKQIAATNEPELVDLHCHILPGIDDGAKT